MVCTNRKQHGFTLVELMITLVIAVILTTIAIPSFNNMIQRNRIATKTNALVSFLAIARSEAVKLGKPVTVCASSNGTACTGGSFDDGWIVFVDTGTSGTVDGTDRILNVQEKLGGGISITFTPPSGGNYVQFSPAGMLSSACEDCIFDREFIAFNNSIPKRSLKDRLIAALLPWGIARADPHSGEDEGEGEGEGSEASGGTATSGGSGGPTGGSGTGTPLPIYTYILCDDNKKAKGQSVIVYGSGRVSSKPYSCP